MTIKEIFETAEDGTLTYEQFQAIAKENKSKFTDISEGNYVSKRKYDDDIEGLNTQITTLNETIGTRDTDLANLQKQLEEAGNDATRLGETLDAFSKLQNKYEADTKAYEEKLKTQSYEFAVKDFANKQNFSSKAARRDFENAMRNAGLKLEGDSILGADDFRAKYAEENEDAFVVEHDEPNIPTFVETTPTVDTGRKLSLSEQMQMKNENPNFVVSF